MARSKEEISRIKEELRLSFEKEFGTSQPNLAKELGACFYKIMDSVKENFIRRKIGHLYETGRNDYVDFLNLCKAIYSEADRVIEPPKVETILPNGIVKKRGRPKA